MDCGAHIWAAYPGVAELVQGVAELVQLSLEYQ
jgi:hypothetical protein